MALAKTLADSYLVHNPNSKFIIGLVDKKSTAVDYAQLGVEVIEIEAIEIPDFADLVNKYNIIELNTAAKPFFIKYLFAKYQDAETVMYLDPDIYVLNSFKEVDKELVGNNILITPHITTPYGVDNYLLSERTFLNYGIFNLGFIAVYRSAETDKFLSWWQERLQHYCYIDFSEGCFTDQIWINYAPVFFKGVKMSFHLGLNYAYWNLHERKINVETNVINGLYPLVFMHISGFNPYKPSKISAVQTRIDINQRPEVLPLYKEYAAKVIANGYADLKKIACIYVAAHNKFQREKALARIHSSPKNRILYKIYRLTPGFIIKLCGAINREMKTYQNL